MTHTLHTVGLAIALSTLACESPASQTRRGTEMSMNELQIRKTIAAEKKWDENAFDVAPVEKLELLPCRFVAATHRTLPIPDPAVYAVLPSGSVVSQADEEAMKKILGVCPAPSQAATWAELLARFHWDVGPGAVDYDAAAPEASDGQVRFRLNNHETSKRYDVTVTVTDGQVGAVQKKLVD